MRASNLAAIQVALLTAMIASCATAEPLPVNSTVAPERRAVHLNTVGCGSASARTGSGIVVEGGFVVTAAHLVARAETVEVTLVEAGPVEAAIVAADYQRDLALLQIPATELGMIEVAPVSPTGPTAGRIVNGASSGDVLATIRRAARISIEEVLGTKRHERLGYELAAETTGGDSGAGFYDEAGRLLGMVFATSDEGKTTWATASSEVISFFEAAREATGRPTCDASRSRLDIP